MAYCSARLGDAYFRTPRETIRGFLDLLALLEQHPGLDWSVLIGKLDLGPTGQPGTVPGVPEDDELTSFQL
jgi:hypothetical protein